MSAFKPCMKHSVANHFSTSIHFSTNQWTAPSEFSAPRAVYISSACSEGPPAESSHPAIQHLWFWKRSVSKKKREFKYMPCSEKHVMSSKLWSKEWLSILCERPLKQIHLMGNHCDWTCVKAAYRENLGDQSPGLSCSSRLRKTQE